MRVSKHTNVDSALAVTFCFSGRKSLRIVFQSSHERMNNFELQWIVQLRFVGVVLALLFLFYAILEFQYKKNLHS